MPISLSSFSRIRPYLFHLTAEANIPKIHQELTLFSSASLLATSPGLLLRKRTGCILIHHNGALVHVRDQAPLYEGNVRFENGWSFADLLHSLNERVFFWPGSGNGPISYGFRHFLRYLSERPAVLRMRFDDLVAGNPTRPPQFCRFNSGSPRCSGGRGSLRGPSTFLEAHNANFSPSSVVEVTFLDKVSLPGLVEYAPSPAGPWKALG